MPTKTCKDCGQTKDLERFAPNKGMKDGRVNQCRACHGEYLRNYRKANPVTSKMSDVRKQAKSKGREFSLTRLDFEVLMHAKCEYCDQPADGFDRIDSTVGYHRHNVTPCCTVCNMMKRDMSYGDFLGQIQRIANKFYPLTQEDQA